MEPYRKEHQLSRGPIGSAIFDAVARGQPKLRSRRLRHRPAQREAGITLIGFLFLATLFGVVGFGVIKLVPMYMRNLTLSSVLSNVSHELSGTGATAGAIRSALNRRFDIEGIELPADNVKINQVRDGYQVRIQYEARAHYVSDVWLLVTFDKQVNIRH